MTQTILAVLLTGTVAVNFFHWRRGSGEKFLYYPQSVWLQVIFGAWGIAAGFASFLFLMQSIPSVAFIAVFISYCIAGEIYSVWRRHNL